MCWHAIAFVSCRISVCLLLECVDRHLVVPLCYVEGLFITSALMCQVKCLCLQMVPQQLAVPWCSVAESLGVKPALSHPCFVLSNWKTVEPSR